MINQNEFDANNVSGPPDPPEWMTDWPKNM